MLTICIDPGHGGKDPGAIKRPLVEKVLNLEFAVVMRDVIRKSEHFAVMTRDSDIYIPNRTRADIANAQDADIFVSLHHNAFRSSKANGFEVLYYPTSRKGKRIATMVCDEVCLTWPIRNRGSKPRVNLSVLRNTKMPAILIEAGFLTSTIDRRKILLDRDERLRFYQSISKTLLEVLDEVC